MISLQLNSFLCRFVSSRYARTYRKTSPRGPFSVLRLAFVSDKSLTNLPLYFFLFLLLTLFCFISFYSGYVLISFSFDFNLFIFISLVYLVSVIVFMFLIMFIMITFCFSPQNMAVYKKVAFDRLAEYRSAHPVPLADPFSPVAAHVASVIPPAPDKAFVVAPAFKARAPPVKDDTDHAPTVTPIVTPSASPAQSAPKCAPPPSGNSSLFGTEPKKIQNFKLKKSKYLEVVVSGANVADSGPKVGYPRVDLDKVRVDPPADGAQFLRKEPWSVSTVEMYSVCLTAGLAVCLVVRLVLYLP